MSLREILKKYVLAHFSLKTIIFANKKMFNKMKVVEKISIQELQEMSYHFFEEMVKGVIDIEKGILAIDAELHADLESLLLQEGAEQENLWGINLYPFLDNEDFLEFDSMINIRPNQNNRSRGVENIEIQNQIREILNQIIIKNAT